MEVEIKRAKAGWVDKVETQCRVGQQKEEEEEQMRLMASRRNPMYIHTWN